MLHVSGDTVLRHNPRKFRAARHYVSVVRLRVRAESSEAYLVQEVRLVLSRGLLPCVHSIKVTHLWS